MTKATKSKNALLHGVYSSDVILPWEKPEDFFELLNGIRANLDPKGALENEIVTDLAILRWKKRRLNGIMQLMLLQNPFAAEVEESGKRSVEGIRAHLDVQRSKAGREHAKYMTAVSALSEVMTTFGAALNEGALEGKLGANMRYLLGQLEELEPIIAAGAKVENNDQRFDPAACVDALSKAFELEARLDGLIDKTLQRFVAVRESLSQYARKSVPKLITHAGGGKTIVTNVAKTKVEDGSDDDNDNDDERQRQRQRQR